MTVEPGAIFAGVLGVANIGGAVYLIRLVIAPLAESVRVLSESVKDLKKLETEVTKIQTIHQIKGCDKPIEAMR